MFSLWSTFPNLSKYFFFSSTCPFRTPKWARTFRDPLKAGKGCRHPCPRPSPSHMPSPTSGHSALHSPAQNSTADTPEKSHKAELGTCQRKGKMRSCPHCHLSRPAKSVSRPSVAKPSLTPPTCPVLRLRPGHGAVKGGDDT